MSFISPKSPCTFGLVCNAFDSFSASAPRLVVVACICRSCSLSDAVERVNDSRLSSIDFFISAITAFIGARMESICVRLVRSSSSERCFNSRSVVVLSCSCTNFSRSANCLSSIAVRSSLSRSCLRSASSSCVSNCCLASFIRRSCSFLLSSSCFESISASFCFAEMSLVRVEMRSDISLFFFWPMAISMMVATSAPAKKSSIDVICLFRS